MEKRMSDLVYIAIAEDDNVRGGSNKMIIGVADTQEKAEAIINLQKERDKQMDTFWICNYYIDEWDVK
jgi:hypothetical protein